jgi:tRNA uridine 5-carboxymethylaminomethyl modification enzyme
LLRQDNADIRLSKKSYDLGLLEKNKLDQVEKKIELSDKLMRFTKRLSVSPEEINEVLGVKSGSKIKQKIKAPKIISRPNIGMNDVIERSKSLKKFIEERLIDEKVIEQVEIDIKYRGYIDREKENADKLKRLEYVKIPANINYFKFSSLSSESKEKLNDIKPSNIGQAARISGIKPSDISILLIYLGR